LQEKNERVNIDEAISFKKDIINQVKQNPTLVRGE